MAQLTILEPMSTGDVIDRAVRLYRRNFAPLVAVAAVPSLIGYVSSMLIIYGYTSMFSDIERGPSPESATTSMSLVLLGMLAYPVWFFALLVMVCGLSRAVADHVMLGEPITFRKCFAAVRKRLGNILVMGLILVVAFSVLYFAFILLALLALLIMGLVGGAVSTAQAPRWFVGTIITLTVLAVVAAGIFVLLVVISRIIFMPQVIMIEGLNAGQAVGRAIKLGAKNWFKVGAVVAFIYFVSVSLLASLTLPVLAVLYLLGYLTAEFFISPTWNLLYTSFSQVANILVLPMWVLSYTLLYFDSRVRKEAYDLELYARELSPGFYWAPSNEPQFEQSRPFAHASPLGLSGHAPGPQFGGGIPQTFDRSPGPAQPSTATDQVQTPVTRAAPVSMPVATGLENVQRVCGQCGADVMPRARFCIRCGASADGE
jgi:hypothetical protein